MNLRPPPKTGNSEFDDWAEEVYRFLQYPHFRQIRFIAMANASESEEGVFYYDTDHYAKIHNGTAFQNLY